MNESNAGRKRARIKGRCLARRAEMKQQGFCLSGCPPLSFPQFTPAGWSPRCMNLAVPFNPFCSTSNSILRHRFVSPRLSAFLPSIRAFPLAPLPIYPSYVTSFLHPEPPPLLPCYNARVYTVCPHSLAYILASYNIDYFERISTSLVLLV